MSYQMRDEDNQLIEKRLKCILPCRTVAKSIFRTIAEEQVFFFQETVTEKIRNHADNSFRRWKKFYRKVSHNLYPDTSAIIRGSTGFCRILATG